MRHVLLPPARLTALTMAAAIGAVFPGLPTTPARAQTTPDTPTVERPSASARVTASVRYANGSKRNVPIWNAIRVSITRDDQVVVKEEPLPAIAAASFFTPPKLLVADLDDDLDPEVLVDVFTAGGDCCRRTVVYHRDTEGRYAPQILEWNARGYRLDDVHGGQSPEFVSYDDRFPALFRSDRRGPVRVEAMVDGVVRDITPSARTQLQRDARVHRRAWRRAAGERRADARPAVAAYVVDLVRLGQVGDARSAIRTAARADELRTSADRFARRIDQRMVAWDYVAKGRLGRLR